MYVVPALVLIMAVAAVGVWLTNRGGAEGASISESSPASTPSNTLASSTNATTPPPASAQTPTNDVYQDSADISTPCNRFIDAAAGWSRGGSANLLERNYSVFDYMSTVEDTTLLRWLRGIYNAEDIGTADSLEQKIIAYCREDGAIPARKLQLYEYIVSNPPSPDCPEALQWKCIAKKMQGKEFYVNGTRVT